MYKLRHIDDVLCNFWQYIGHLLHGDCETYSLWSLYRLTKIRLLQNIYRKQISCNTYWFSVFYWLILFISIAGSIHSFSEFVRLIHNSPRKISMWKYRRYYILSYTTIRRFRIFGSLIMLNAWLMLWYAITIMSPAYTTPWLIVNLFIIVAELIMSLVRFSLGNYEICFHSVVSYIFQVGVFTLVYYIRNAFEHSLGKYSICSAISVTGINNRIE